MNSAGSLIRMDPDGAAPAAIDNVTTAVFLSCSMIVLVTRACGDGFTHHSRSNTAQRRQILERLTTH